MSDKSFVTESIKNMPPSGIRKFFDLAYELKDVISLGVGEPDFITPWSIREEAIYFMKNRRSLYTSNSGLLELREEISKYMSSRYGLEYSPKNQIVVTVGASEGIDIALRAVINPGDEVLVAEPCFVSYKPCVAMAGGIPVPINTKAENRFRLTADELRDKITDKTKALIISYPNNPTGAIMEKTDLEKIAEVLKDKNILVISDEIYSELTYNNREHVSIATLPGMYDKTIVINGFSKAYSMTGWRLGYACGPSDIIQAMVKIHQYIIMCAPTISQWAGIEALRNGSENVAKMRREYEMRLRVIVKGFNDMGLECFEPAGAFYVFPSIQKTGMSSEAFCTKLLFDANVAVVPGTAFGDSGEGFVRCSYACSIEQIKTALLRIKAFIEK